MQEQNTHGGPVEFSGYMNETLRDTFENWQSEFLQLIWQVAGLSILWYVGSPQSKEEHDRTEEKIDFIIKKLEPENAKTLLEVGTESTRKSDYTSRLWGCSGKLLWSLPAGCFRGHCMGLP